MRKFEIKNDKYVIYVESSEKTGLISVNIATSHEGLTLEDFQNLAQDIYDLKEVIR